MSEITRDLRSPTSESDLRSPTSSLRSTTLFGRFYYVDIVGVFVVFLRFLVPCVHCIRADDRSSVHCVIVD